MGEMKLVLLDGTAGEPSPVVAKVLELARGAGASCTHVRPAAMRLAPCLGDFDCWVKTPGLCRSQDEHRTIAQEVHDADVLVYATPLSFGGYSSALKLAVDRLIGLVEPFFERRHGLTHHRARYPTFPRLLLLGWSDAPSDDARRAFAELASANAINMCAPWRRSLVFSPRDESWGDRVEEALGAALGGGSGDEVSSEAPHEVLEAMCAPSARSLAAAPRSATLLVGSARPPGQSTSESLGRALLMGLERGGVTSRVVRAIDFVKAGQRMDEALERMAESDLLVVSAPLYVDGLPALATRALEVLATRVAQRRCSLGAVVGVVNCGFPEAAHARTAMRLLRCFASETELVWAGGLAMGGGEALHGRPVAEAGGTVRAQARAIELAAEDLAQGRTLRAEAMTAMAKPVVPALLYRWFGTLRWVRRAWGHGLSRAALHARPHGGRGTSRAEG